MTALQHLRATIWVHDKVDISFLAMLEHLETLHLKVSYYPYVGMDLAALLSMSAAGTSGNAV